MVTFQELRTFRDHTSLRCAALNPDGQAVATGGRDKTIKLWEVATGREIRTFPGHTGEVVELRFSADGRWLASTSEDCTVRVWDVRTGKELRTFRGHTDITSNAVFSPDGKRLFSASCDGTVKVWDLTPLHAQRGLTTGLSK
jgi:WD40 repeat protein